MDGIIFDKNNWYWLLADGRVWSTAKAAFVDASEGQAWAEAHGMAAIPASPVDASRDHSEQGLIEALAFYELPLGELSPSPTLEEAKESRVREINANTSRLILAGFDYGIDGEVYHFGYDAEDQGNFTKATLAATLAIVGKQPFSQPWRGWKGDVPHTLTLDAQGMIALATFAGVEHQQALLQAGWALTELVRNAETIEEVEGIVDGRGA